MTKITLLDSSLAYQLSSHVGEKIDGDPLWTARFLVTNPNAILAMHLDFLRAGCNIICTNTYQASVTGFIKYLNKTEEESINLIKSAVKLAQRAIEIYKEETKDTDVPNKNPLIAGACGPYGAAQHDGSEYTGLYGKSISPTILLDFHRIRIKALIDAGVDLLALETIPCREEGDALVNLLKSEFPTIKAWLSFSCREDGNNIADGSNFQETAIQCYNRSQPNQILAIGVNCLLPKIVTSLFKGINSEARDFIPLIVYANSGEKYFPNEKKWKMVQDSLPSEYFVKEWIDLGVRYIGGCCRTNVTNLKKIADEIQAWKDEREINV
ncbi:uncharacterized protein LOC127281140 [Leptopilina boulardi]|uniref:uncharacterized protein LOC127281140 n=1 Tax=Leptopilina boulardi TaxID=63433 RepID=UPI0021F51240|nr:uncharacterized protein LOC127281140 [Leptopilina boulardi]